MLIWSVILSIISFLALWSSTTVWVQSSLGFYGGLVLEVSWILNSGSSCLIYNVVLSAYNLCTASPMFLWLLNGKAFACHCKRHQEMRDRSLGWEDALEKETANHSSSLARRIQWKEEPGRVQPIRSDTTEWLSTHTYIISNTVEMLC